MEGAKTFDCNSFLLQAFANCFKESAKLCELVRRQETEQLAYFLWEEAGRPEGRSEEFWFQAERALG